MHATSDIDLSQGLGPLRFFPVLPAKQCKQVSHGSVAQSTPERHVRVYRVHVTCTNLVSLDISCLLEIYNNPVCRSLRSSVTIVQIVQLSLPKKGRDILSGFS